MSARASGKRNRPKRPRAKGPELDDELRYGLEPNLSNALLSFLFGAQPIERLVLLRIFAPLAILGFMSSRMLHADYWIGNAGFWVPDLGGDWRQPHYLPALGSTATWGLVTLLALSGLATSAGLYTRLSALIFGATLSWVALADRLSAFTVSKLGPMIAVTLCVSAAGAAYSLDSWRARRKNADYVVPRYAPGGPTRFIQLFLPIFYSASGMCKAHGDWLKRGDVLWTHLSGSYQTAFAHFLGNHLPAVSWLALQALTLGFELLAPLWFGWSRSRRYALVYGVGMHAMIGLMFGPVIWFSLLMITLLSASFLPLSKIHWLLRPLASREAERAPLPAASA